MFFLSFKNKKAFSLLEIILAVAIFSGAAISVGYLIIDASKTTEINTRKIGALFYAKEGIEAVRSIRNDVGFVTIASHLGDNGLSFDLDTKTWSFVGTSDSPDDGIYTRIINIRDDETDTKLITSTVTAGGSGRTVTTSLVTKITNWR